MFIEQLESRELLAVTGTRDLLYVRVRFSDQSGFPESVQTAQGNTAQATKWITDYSGQNVHFNVRLATATLSHSTSYYKSKGTGAIAADADAALKSQGIGLGGFEHISYRYNGPIGTFAGLGQISAPRTWIRSSSASVIAHEMGHNLGLGHAKFANPKDNTKPFGSSTLSEYGDPFSNMGGGGGKDWNAHEKYSRGWLGGARTRTISAAAPGTYKLTLTSHDDATTYQSSSLYLVKLNLNSSTAYYISYRHSPDAVFIHRASPTNPTSGALIDATPKTESASDAGLAFGKKITDPRGSGTSDDITIAATRSGNRAVITITIGAAATATRTASATSTGSAVTPPSTTVSNPVYHPAVFADRRELLG